MMIAATYNQGQPLQFADVPRSANDDDELLVCIGATSFCGTDVKITRHGQRKLESGQTSVPGHEFGFSATQAGARVSQFQADQRVGATPNIGGGNCETRECGLMNMFPDYSAFRINLNGSPAEFMRITAPAFQQVCDCPVARQSSALPGLN